MSRKGPKFEIEVLVEPGASAVVEGDTEITVMLRTRLEAPPDAAAAPLHLAIAPLGPGASNAAPILRALSLLRAGDRLSLPGVRTVTIGEGGAAEGLAQALDEAFTRPYDTAAAALSQAREALSKDRHPEFAHRLLLVAHSPVVEPMEPLLGAATSLTDRQLGLDVITTTPHMDLGLMIRLANLGGGEVVYADSHAALEAALRQRLQRLTQQHLVDLRLELEFVPGVVPGRMFRLAPCPVFLGNIRLTPTDRRLVLDPGPVAPGHEPVFVLTLTVPRRRAGRYRLVEVAARHRGAHRQVTDWQGSVLHVATDDPLETGQVESAVISARDRVEPSGWVEEAARAFLEGDHRRVATTLERLTRRFQELGRTAEAQATAESRTRYLRVGHLDRNELNKLRRLAAQA